MAKILSDNAMQVFKSRYAFDENEDWSQCSKRVGDAIGSLEKNSKYKDKFQEMIYNMDLLPGGRILRNSGRARGSLLNCMVLSVADSIEAIGQYLKDALILWSEGSGVGCNFSPLRKRGDIIQGKGGVSSGLCSFIEAADAVAKTVESGGNRRAASLICVDVSHPEVLDFIDAKLVHGKLSHCNISVNINNEFLEAVEADKDYEFKFQQRSYGNMKARNIWNKILSNMVTSAEPGLLNTSNLYKNNSYYFAMPTSTNPCFSKGTLIQTKLGPRKIETLIGQNVEIWDGEQWVWCDNFRVTGENQPVLKITLRDKSILEVTPYHTMILENKHILPAKELIIGHRLMPSYVPNMPIKDINCHVIEDIKEIGIQKKVYCCTIHSTHKLAISIGILTSNCGEAILEPYGACDLASLVLPNFISDQGRTNWKKLEEVINLAVRFLDNVLDLNKYPIKQIDETCHLSRRIGLGIMGLAEYLFSKKVRYGSLDSISEIEKLMKFIRDTTYIASIELAVEKGSFPKFDPVAFGKASFVRKLPAPLRKEIKTKGIRNVTLLSIAPTGSISLLPEVTSGCEPLFSKAYRRKDRVSERIYIHPIYRNLITQSNLIENKELPDWFVDTSDLQPIDHFNVQVVLTKNTDGGVSKTINLPKGTTVDQLSEWLLEYLYDLKGVTVYVDGSREGQVLNHISHEEAVKLVLEGKDTTDVPEEQKCHSGVCEI